jgi:hypothetical protein
MEAVAREGLRWYPRIAIEKYSVAQVARFRRRLGGPLTGEMLHHVFPEPEDGTLHDEGNGLTVAGLLNLSRVLTGEVTGHPLSPGRAVFGVGSDDTPFDREHVHLSRALGEEPGRSWYRPMDQGYPRANGLAIEGQATFTESEACFEWREWCWASGPGRPAPHHALHGAYGGEQPVMVNRKASPQGYGLKEPGVAWVFRTVVELS